MEINDLPNVSKYWTKNGYLNFELITGDWIRLNFNNIQALKEQLTIHDVVKSLPIQDLPNCTRVEVIDQNGRSYVNWKPTNKVRLSMQDEGRTAKVFID